MADEKLKNTQEEFIDSLSSSTLDLQTLAAGLAEFSRTTEMMTAITAAVTRNSKNIFRNLSTLQKSLEELSTGKQVDALQNVAKMNEQQISRLLLGMKSIWDSLEGVEKLAKGATQKQAALKRMDLMEITRPLVETLKLSMDGVTDQINKIVKSSLESAAKAAMKKVQASVREFDKEALRRGRRQGETPSAHYKRVMYETVAPLMETNRVRKIAKEILTSKNLPTRALAYPAASGGKYHQRDATVISHSLDMAQILTKELKGKSGTKHLREILMTTDDAGRTDKFTGRIFSPDEIKRLTKTELMTLFAHSRGIDLTGKQLSSMLGKKGVQDMAVLSALLHDLGKYKGYTSTHGKGLNPTHAEDLVNLIESIQPSLSKEESATLHSALKAASLHHTSDLGKAMAGASNIEKAAAVLTQLSDAISALNANPPEGPDTDKFSQKAISKRPNVFSVMDPSHDLSPWEKKLRGAALFDEDPRGFLSDLLREISGGPLSDKDYARAQLDYFGFGSIGKMFEDLPDPIRQILHYTKGVEGRQAVGPGIKDALQSLLGTASSRAQLTPKELGAALLETDPALAVMQALNPAFLKGIVEDIRAGTLKLGDPKEATEIADGLDAIVGAIDTIIPEGNALTAIKLLQKRASQISRLNDLKRVSAEVPPDPTGERDRVQKTIRVPFKTLPDQAATSFNDQLINMAQMARAGGGGGAPPPPPPGGGPPNEPPDDWIRRLMALINKMLLEAQSRLTGMPGSGVSSKDLLVGSPDFMRGIGEAIALRFKDLKPDEQLTAMSSLKTAAEASFKARSLQLGVPEAKALQEFVAVQKVLQQIDESRAKAAIMSARAKKTEVETDTLLKTQAADVAKARSLADKAHEDSVAARVKAELAEQTQADKVLQTKTKTLEVMSKLTEAQKATVIAETEAALQSSKHEALQFEVPKEHLEEYEKQMAKVEKGIKRLAREEAAAAKAAGERSTRYQSSSTSIRDAMEKALAGLGPEDEVGAQAIRDLATQQMAALREQNRLDKEASDRKVQAAKQSLTNELKELDLLKQKFTLESDILTIKAKGSMAQSDAQIRDFQAIQHQVQATIDQATQEDVIYQRKLQSLKMEQELRAQILTNVQAQYGIGQRHLQQTQQQAGLIQQIANAGALGTAIRAFGAGSPSGFSYTGMGRGQGINTGALRYSTSNAIWGVLGGLTAIGSTTQLLRESVQNMKDYETAIINLKRVWQEVPENQVLKALADMNEMAMKYGQTIQNVAEIQEAWAKVGIDNANDLERLSEVSILALNTSDIKQAETAVEYLNSARVQMGLTVDQTDELLDSWNKLADETTADTSDFAEAYQKAAGYARQVGLTFRELDSIIAAMVENTGRSGEEIGTALRQMFSNVYSPKNIQKLQALGVEVYKDPEGIRDGNAALKEFDELLGDIVAKYRELKKGTTGLSPDLLTLLGTLGESRRRNYAIALLEGYGRSGLNTDFDTDTYLGASAASAGYSQKKFEMTIDTMVYKAGQLQAAFTQAAWAFGESGILDTMKAVIDKLTEMFTWFSKLEPETRDWLVALTMTSVVLGGIGKLTKAAFGQSLTESLAKALINSRNLNKIWQQLKVNNPLTSLGSKEMTKYKAMQSSLNIGGLMVDFKSIEDAMGRNKDFMEQMTEQARLAGMETADEIDSYIQKTITGTLASMGSVEHAARINKEANDQLTEALSKTASATQNVGSQAQASATQVNAKTQADIEQRIATAQAANGNFIQATAMTAVGKAAALATFKMIALNTAISLGLTLIISAIAKWVMARDAIEEVSDKLIVEIQRERDEIKSLETLKARHEELSATLAASNKDSKEYNALHQERLDIEKELYQIAPSLGEYYDAEHGYIVRNSERLEEYIRLKKEAAGRDTETFLDSAPYVEERIKREMEARKRRLDRYHGATRLASYLRQNPNPTFEDIESLGLPEETKQMFMGVALGGDPKEIDKWIDKETPKIKELQQEYMDLGDELFQFTHTVTQTRVAQYLADNPDLVINVDFDRIVAKVSARAVEVETVLSELEDKEDTTSIVNEAIGNILTGAIGSNKYKSGTKALINRGFGNLEIDLEEGPKTVAQLIASGDIKSYLADVARAVKDSLVETANTDLVKLQDTLDKAKKDYDDTLVQLNELDEEIRSKQEFRARFENEALTLYRTMFGPGDAEARRDFVEQYVEESMSESDKERYQALSSEIDRAMNRRAEVQRNLYRLGSLITEAEEQMVGMDPDDIKIDIPDYTAIAQEFVDKLIGADTEAELNELLKKVQKTFGDTKIGDKLLSEIEPERLGENLRDVIYAMNLKATGGIESAHKAAGEFYRTLNTKELKVTLEGILGQSVEDKELISGMIEKIPEIWSDWSLDISQTPGLSKVIEEYAKKYGLTDGLSDIEGFVSLFQDGSIQLDSFAKQAGEALATLDKAVETGYDIYDTDIRNAVGRLQNLFKDLMIGDISLGQMSAEAIIRNRDAISSAITEYLNDQSEAAQIYAQTQLDLVDAAIDQLSIIMSDANGLIEQMINQSLASGSISEEDAAGVRSAFSNYFSAMEAYLAEKRIYQANLLENLKAPRPTVDTFRSESNKWSWLDKALAAVERRIGKLTSAIETLDTVWANDLTNQKYIAKAYEKQNDLIDEYLSAISEVTRLREKTRGDEEKYQELTDLIDDYTRSLIGAYQKQSQLFEASYQDRIEETTRRLERLTIQQDLAQASARTYNQEEVALAITLQRLDSTLESVNARYRATQSEIARTRQQITELERAQQSAGDSFKAMYASGQLDYLRDRLEDLSSTLDSLGLEAEQIRATVVDAFATRLSDAYNASLDEQLKRIRKIRKEEEERHEERIEYLNKLLEDKNEEWKAEEDKRALEDLEAEIAIVKIRISRLGADTSQYGQKLLKDAYKQLGDLETQYADKNRQIEQEAYRKRIQDRIDRENEAYEELMDGLEDEESAYQQHYKTLLDNARSFAEGLYDTYQNSQTAVIEFLKSDDLMSAYLEAGKMATAAYNAGLTLRSPTMQKGFEDYESKPKGTYGNTGDYAYIPPSTWTPPYEAPAPTPAPQTPEETYRSYTIKGGDTLSGIAKNMLGDYTRWREIYELNKAILGDDPNLIHPGKVIKIPSAHTGGIVGGGKLPSYVRALFGLEDQEALVKGLVGEYMIPGDMMAQLKPGLQGILSAALNRISNNISIDDLVKTPIHGLAGIGGSRIGNLDQSMNIDKVMNIEHAVFQKEMDVEVLERVAGQYLKNTLSRKGVVGIR